MALACRVCGSTDLAMVLDLGEQPHCNSLLTESDLAHPEPVYPLRLWFCRGCTTVQIDYTVPKETMFSEYLYVSGTTATLREHFRQSADHLVAELGLQPGDLVVDIGSNDGTWLKAFQARGMRALGVEPASNIARQAEAEGVPTLNRFFNAGVAREIAATESPHLVTAAGVFFHLEELHSAAEGVAELCRHGAVFCVQAIYLREMLRETAFDNIYHEHLTYWTLRSISALFSRHGLEVFSARVVPIHGGSLELLVAPAGARAVERSVTAMLEQETAEGLGELATYEAFAARVQRIREELPRLVRRYTDGGKLVYAFGAPAKGATMLNSCGIGTDLLRYSTERNPLKVGKFMPGSHLPIVEEGSVPDPDAYLVLPWNFLAEFLRRNRDYLEQGGAFIVPVPEPRVIDASNVERELALAELPVGNRGAS